MNMSERRMNRFLSLIAVILITGTSLFAQSGAGSSHSPYTIFGLGDIISQGSAYNKSMGGTGIATRSKKMINYLNPASVTARDSLSFMTDFGLSQTNKLYRQNDLHSGSNLCNINDIVISFPIYRSLAIMVGIAPYSGIGYEFATYFDDQSLIGQTGNMSGMSQGTGSMYQLFAAAGMTFWKRLSVGVEYIRYFGNLEKVNVISFSQSGYNGVSTGNKMYLKANAVKFGVQYENNVGNCVLDLGATYGLDANLKGNVESYKISTGSLISDTLKYNLNDFTKDKVQIAGELGVGVSLKRGEKWRAEIDYTRSDWRNTGMDKVAGFSNNSRSVFTAGVAEAYRAGFEFVPNINDVRYYFRRCSYKAGAYYKNDYFLVDGNKINSMGITLGMTFPVLKLYNNGISVGVDLGQRGSLQGDMIRERYVNFTIGLNGFDIWFQKQRYR